MKKLISLLFITAFCFTIISTKAQSASANKKDITGAWVSADGNEFTIMNDGFFSSVSKDSATGSWNQTHAGSYTLDNANTITFKVLYSSFPDHIGALNTTEYDLNGDTVTMKWFKKLVDGTGADITNQVPQNTQTQYVRAKK